MISEVRHSAAAVLAIFSLLGISLMTAVAADAPDSAGIEFFETKIRPVLVEHCYKCHSDQIKTPKGNLRLDTRDAISAGGDSGPAVVPGKPDESPLLSALKYEDTQMPPKGKLPAAVIADFQKWIEIGAPDPRSGAASKNLAGKPKQIAPNELWSLQKPIAHKPPEVKQSGLVKNEIDRFILKKLEEKSMHPAQPADKRTLLRRAWFDLVGLPPSPDTVENFVKDNSPNAFEKALDELLASRHYGERWGRYWLDLARFAQDQAHTFKARMYPNGWLYRDWIVSALNDDMPYDKFLKYQIAADLINPPDVYKHRAALGLFALGPVYYQDNGEKDKAMADEWDDRLDTLMRGTQAMTVACARCHDHKYDPISMADYYGLSGIFASSDYAEEPSVPAEVVDSRSRADQAVADQKLKIDAFSAAHIGSARLSLAKQIPDYMVAAWQVISDQKTDKSKKNKKYFEQKAAAAKLHPVLLERWTNLLLAEKDFAENKNKPRDYLAEWTAFRKTNASGKAPGEWQPGQSADAEARVRQMGRSMEELAVKQAAHRHELLKYYGENFAIVKEADRYQPKAGEVPLGNLFDDSKGTSLSSAVASDPFKAVATENSLGVTKLANGWGKSVAVAEGIRIDFSEIGSDKHAHGQVTNDGWSNEGGISTTGKKTKADLSRTEQGIGMHANALMTIDLDEIRRSGILPQGMPMSFKVDRAGINDDSLGAGADVNIGVVLSKPHTKRSEYDAIVAAWLNGQPAKVIENDTLYHFKPNGSPPLKADGKFVAFDIAIPPSARYLTIVVTGARSSETENTISSDHAVLSGARLTFDPAAVQLTANDQKEATEGVQKIDPSKMANEARFLSELFDDRGVLGLPPADIEPYLQKDDARAFASLKADLSRLEKAASTINITNAHTLREGTRRDLNIYMAGDPKKQGSRAPRGFPASFLASNSARPQVAGSGRKELAEAITSTDNPLTARVVVNRVWAGHFGAGIVKTLTNFGQLGDRPSHPELLDYLALDFMAHGWSLKRLHKQIMMSYTYQQASTGEQSNDQVDPENRLLWRANRRRLEIEPWRDAVLAISGKLDTTYGGQSSELTDSNVRRTIYGYVSRHRLNELLRLFDFPDPNITAGERTVTTVPLQQLFVLNSNFMISQAQAFAGRLQKEAPADDEARIRRAFALLFGRSPEKGELESSLAFLKSGAAKDDRLTPLEQFCLAMLGTNELVYVD
jgi:hypothetical protein